MRGSLQTVALLFFFSAMPCAAQADAAGSLKVELTPAEITVGDRVEAEVTLVWMGAAPAAKPRFPVWQETWGPAEVLSAGPVEGFTDPSGRHVYRQAVVLTAFRTGEVELPPLTVAVPIDGETVAVTQDGAARFAVRSVLPEAGDEPLEPRVAAPPVELDADRRFPATATILAGLCLLAAGLLTRRLDHGRGRETARRKLEPLEELYERLRRLDPAAGEPAHTGLSLGLRHFLGRSLDLRAVEGTTSEIRRRLGQAPVTPDVAQGTVRLLQDCDQVKFARAGVDPAHTEERLLAARELAREIDDGLRPVEPAEVPGVAGAAGRAG